MKPAHVPATGSTVQLFIVKGANHTAVYDNTTGKIPFDKFEQFFKKKPEIKTKKGRPYGRLLSKSICSFTPAAGKNLLQADETAQTPPPIAIHLWHRDAATTLAMLSPLLPYADRHRYRRADNQGGADDRQVVREPAE